MEIIEELIKRDHCIYSSDGSVKILIDSEGLPELECLIPAPFMDEVGRDKMVAKAVDGFYLSGYFLVEQKRIRNLAFDKGKEKTTTRLRYRVCKNEDEALLVGEKIKAILEAMKEDASEAVHDERE